MRGIERTRCALVLGDYRQSLVIARSLNRAGFQVVLGSAGTPSAIRLSRHIGRFWRHPDLATDPSGFDAALAAFAAATAQRLVVFPVGDRQVAHFAANPQALPAHAVAVMAAAEGVITALNKPALYETARRIGLEVADFEAVESTQVEAAIARIGCPCVVKPASSLDDPAHIKALVLERTPGPSIAQLLGRSSPGWRHALVQRRVDGQRHNCHFVAHHGRLLAYFEQRVLRTTRLDGTGNGTDGLSVPASPDRRRACERLVTAIGYSGPGCVQFLVDARRGRSWLLELNPRLDATCAIAERCGYDLPRLATEEALHRAGLGARPAALSHRYRVGIRAVWTTGELRALLGELRARRLNARTALRWLARIGWSFLAADHHLTFRWTDPQPAAAAMIDLIARAAYRGARRRLWR